MTMQTKLDVILDGHIMTLPEMRKAVAREALKHLSVGEAARQLGVHRSTLVRWGLRK